MPAIATASTKPKGTSSDQPMLELEELVVVDVVVELVDVKVVLVAAGTTSSPAAYDRIGTGEKGVTAVNPKFTEKEYVVRGDVEATLKKQHYHQWPNF